LVWHFGGEGIRVSLRDGSSGLNVFSAHYYEDVANGTA